jgi:hypothetical protein
MSSRLNKSLSLNLSVALPGQRLITDFKAASRKSGKIDDPPARLFDARAPPLRRSHLPDTSG